MFLMIILTHKNICNKTNAFIPLYQYCVKCAPLNYIFKHNSFHCCACVWFAEPLDCSATLELWDTPLTCNPQKCKSTGFRLLTIYLLDVALLHEFLCKHQQSLAISLILQQKLLKSGQNACLDGNTKINWTDRRLADTCSYRIMPIWEKGNSRIWNIDTQHKSQLQTARSDTCFDTSIATSHVEI